MGKCAHAVSQKNSNQPCRQQQRLKSSSLHGSPLLPDCFGAIIPNPRQMRRGCCNHEIHKIHETRACRGVCPRLFKILSTLLKTPAMPLANVVREFISQNPLPQQLPWPFITFIAFRSFRKSDRGRLASRRTRARPRGSRQGTSRPCRSRRTSSADSRGARSASTPRIRATAPIRST